MGQSLLEQQVKRGLIVSQKPEDLLSTAVLILLLLPAVRVDEFIKMTEACVQSGNMEVQLERADGVLVAPGLL